MDQKTFSRIRNLIYEKSGITLGENKESLVKSRLAKRMRVLGIGTHKEYLAHLTEDASGDELILMIDAISTNVTSFFREKDHFTFTKEVFEKWIQNGQKRFRFWSAACSSGEEPYTLGITLSESANIPGLDLRILATDISTQVLGVAKKGIYTKEKLKTVLPQLRQSYFTSCGRNGDRVFTVKESLKSLILFKRMNLATPPYPMRGPMDIIFCRNVMIYFDNRVRKMLLDEFTRLLKPGGYLIVGHAESLAGMLSNLKNVRPSVYIKE